MQHTYLVTGARLGIGRAVCGSLLAAGHQVIGVSRRINEQPLEHENFIALEADLTQLQAVESCAKAARDLASGQLQGAVFCAGKGLFGHLEELSADEITGLLDLNLTSQILLTKHLIGQFKRDKQGLLVYMGSEAALQGGRKGTLYCASKFGLRGFVQALNEECSASGVRATIINPGMVDTPFFDQFNFGPGEDAMNAIAPQTIGDMVAHLAEMPPETVVDEITLSPRKRVILKS